MKHPWFKDVNWNQVLSKAYKPPLIPDINSDYFDNEDNDDGTVDHNITRSSVNQATCVLPGNKRRQSYYIHSTV